jgi:hypothetical protein
MNEKSLEQYLFKIKYDGKIIKEEIKLLMSSIE